MDDQKINQDVYDIREHALVGLAKAVRQSALDDLESERFLNLLAFAHYEGRLTEVFENALRLSPCPLPWNNVKFELTFPN